MCTAVVFVDTVTVELTWCHLVALLAAAAVSGSSYCLIQKTGCWWYKIDW